MSKVRLQSKATATAMATATAKVQGFLRGRGEHLVIHHESEAFDQHKSLMKPATTTLLANADTPKTNADERMLVMWSKMLTK